MLYKTEYTVKRVDLNTGVIPLAEFRANATRCVIQVRETRRPMVITQHGKSASVLMDVGEYEKLMADTNAPPAAGR